jgi:hypothetical protein
VTAYTLAASANLRQIGTAGIWGVATARTSADTVDTNGFNLLVDQDSRYGLSGNTSAVWGALTINASKGGQINFDGRYVRMIPFTGGSGTITAGGTVVAGSSASGAVIGIYASLTTAPVLTAATGWIKVTAWNGTAYPTSGTFTDSGFTYTISGPSIVGFIEVVGQEAGTINANRLGSVNVTGEWFELGTTTGVTNQTLQIPNNGLTCWHPGVFIEKVAGSGDFEFYPNNGLNTTTGVEATRGKVVWIDATGLVRINNSGAATNGFLPVTGLRVVIGNVFFNNAVTTLTANVIPNATVATRYDFTTTGGGVLNIDKCSMMWYLSVSQAYSVNVSNSGFSDAIFLSEVATSMTFSKVGVGNKPTTALVTNPLTMTYCYAGGTFTDCVWLKNSGAAAGVTNTYQDIAGFTFVRDKYVQGVIRAIATSHCLSVTRAVNCVWTTPTVIQGSMQFITCNGITVTDTIYCDCVSGTTVTTYAMYVWNLSSNTINSTFSGLTLPVTNTQPYTALLIGATGCSGIKLRNIGTFAVPLTLGSVNGCGVIYSIGTNCSDFKFQRLYTSNTRTGIMGGDNSCIRITEENVWGDYADAVDVMAILNHKRKGMGGTGAVSAQTAVYGTHWSDGHTSTTVSRIAILMNEPNALTTSQVTLTGGAAFTSAGGLYMPTIGMTATFEMPEYIIGHVSFTNSAAIMAGGTATNYTYGFQIDKNDGAGWSTLTSGSTATTLATALNALTGIDATKGFKLRIKVTTGTANTTAITSLYLITASTTTTQAYQYPLDTNTVTFTGLPTGCDVVVLTAGTTTVLTSVDANAGTSYGYTFSGAQTVDVGFIKPGYVPFYIRNLSLTAVDSSIPINLTVDRNYTA